MCVVGGSAGSPVVSIALFSSCVKTKMYVMYKDLNHVSLTITVSCLESVASQFSSAAHAWVRSVNTDSLLVPWIPSAARSDGGQLLRFPRARLS